MPLNKETKPNQSIYNAAVIPIVFSGLGTVHKGLEKKTGKLMKNQNLTDLRVVKIG